MSETIDCTNCCIADFKHSLCDCHGDFCAKYKSIGDENDFMNAVLADRPSGEWLWQLADNGWADHICSVCGYTKNTDIHVSLNWSYCPHCGSKMRGEHDD